MNMNVHNREVKERSKTIYSPKKKKKNLLLIMPKMYMVNCMKSL